MQKLAEHSRVSSPPPSVWGFDLQAPSGTRVRAWLLIGAAGVLIGACTPTVKLEAPKEPITINLNIKADVRVTLEEAAKKDIEANPELF